MSKINRVLFHFKNGTLFSTLVRIFRHNIIHQKDTPIGNTYFGEKAAIYDEHRQNDPYWKAEDDCMNEYVQLISSEISSVIDAPYGTGRFAPIYAKFDLDVVALDISSEMIDVAKNKHSEYIAKTTFLIQDMNKIVYPDSSIDLAVCFRFIPWIVSFQDAEKSLSELSRVCKKYAIIELCVGSHQNVNTVIQKDKILWDKYNKDQLVSWLNKFDLEVIDVKFLFNDDQHPGLSAFLCKKVKKS